MIRDTIGTSTGEVDSKNERTRSAPERSNKRQTDRPAATAGEGTETMTQKEIYAAYGIEFDGTYLISPFGPVRPLLKQGNEKVGRNVWTWSLPAGTAGTCCCDCPGCYAKTGHYSRDSVKECLSRHKALVEFALDWTRRAITAQLWIIGPAEIRIHAAGDFQTSNSAEYMDMWRRIVSDFPESKFWTYTKVSDAESLFDGMENAHIVPSIIPGIGVNYGHCDYIIAAYTALKAAGESVYICRCGIDKAQHCEGCGHCLSSKYVLFLEHSTEYKAQKDVRYSELVELVNSQE